jgi:hypothetical protein
MTAPTPNAELAYRVLDHIDAHPEQHDQGTWIKVGTDCGTVACFAGWTCLLAGDTPAIPLITIHNEVSRVTVVEDGNEDHAHDRSVKYRAAELLGLYSGEWRQLFYVGSRAALGRVVAEIFGPRPGEHVNCPHDPEGADGNPFAAMICAPMGGAS